MIFAEGSGGRSPTGWRMGFVPTGHLADVPVDVERDEARRAAAAELADHRYQEAQPSLVQRVLNWLVEWFSDFFGALSAAAPGGVAGLVVLGLLLVVLVVVIRLRVGKLARTRAAGGGEVFGGTRVTAADHRAAAEAAWARGAFDDVVRERFRAIARELDEQGVLEARAGRTADEVASEAGTLMPAVQDELRAAARIFDDVHYGGKPATPEACARLAELDTALRRGRVAVS